MPNRASAAWRRPSSALRRRRRRPRSRGGGGGGGAGHPEHWPGMARASRGLRAPHTGQQSQGVRSDVAARARERRRKGHEFEAKRRPRTLNGSRKLPPVTAQWVSDGGGVTPDSNTTLRPLRVTGAAEVGTHTPHRAHRGTSPHGRCRCRSPEKTRVWAAPAHRPRLCTAGAAAAAQSGVQARREAKKWPIPGCAVGKRENGRGG